MDAQLLLKIKFNCFYNYQKILNENLIVIFSWFALLCNMITKYGIQLEDFYNFNETSFMINVIVSFIIIICFDKCGKIKFI